MGNIKLVPLSTYHIDDMVRWRNIPRVRDSFFTKESCSYETQSKWIDEHISNSGERNFIINLGDRPIGAFSIYHIFGGSAEFGRLYIGEEDCLGKGYAKEAEIQLIKYGFNTLNLDDMFAFVDVLNYKVVNMHMSLGMSIKQLLHIGDTNIYKIVCEAGSFKWKE